MTTNVHRLDIPEKHYLEAELEELVRDEKVWRFIRPGSLDGVWFWDLENPSNEWISPELWDLLGFDPATRSHDPAEWQDLIHPDDLALAIENIERHCADPDPPYDQIVRYRHADGSTVWLRCRGFAIRRPDGTPIRMLGAHNDVTALKRAEESALRERVLADRANEELQTFAYSTSHDLKSPANTVCMLLKETRLALKKGDLEDADQLLAKTEATNEAMRLLVQELLAFTRVIGGETDMATFDLDRTLKRVLENLSSDIERSGAKNSLDTCPQLHGCEWQVRQMLQNLISNAIKFRVVDRTPRITVRTRGLEPGRITLEVEDNGIGIAAEDQRRIFNLFAKLHRPSAFKGSGIGLAFCHRVAQAHGGDITVQSIPGTGTVFRVSLPH